MLAAGESGCPFPQPLAAARAALAHPDFVRDDAELVVVILTNHDDGSAPPDTDLFDATKTARYGHLDRYARQTRAGVVCGSPPVPPPYAASSGPLADCAAAPNPDGRGPGRLDDVGLLDRLLTTPRAAGGLKSFPRLDRVVVFAGPASPFEVILADPDLPPNAPLPACAPLSESPPACVPRVRPSCRGADPRFAAEPAVRLADALAGNPHPFLRRFESICDTDYAGVLASLFSSPFCLSCGGGCVFVPLAPDPLHPECHAEDVTQNADGSQTTIRLERCIDPDPRGDDAPPCWRVEPTDRCWILSPDRVRLRVDRHGRPAPAHTVSWFTCSTTC